MTSAFLLTPPLLIACSLLGFAYARSRRELGNVRRQLATLNTERVAEQQLLAERSALDTLKDEFISNVSHELRTPLTSIRGSLGLLSSGALAMPDPKARHLLRIALSNTDRLIRLINDILDLERMQSGRSPLEIRRCSLQELTELAVETMKPLAETAGINLALEIERTGAGLFLDGDPDRIIQVLTNLLSNAIKFSPRASTVRIHAEAGPESILLRVVDQGRGIPLDKLDSIFDRFQQVEQADARSKGGTGLGLAICRTIVTQHAGSIWAQGNAEGGSSFHVLLPRTARVTDATVALPTLPVAEGRILICDDEPGIRTVVAEHLTRQGYHCLEASSGEEAIRIASHEPVEAILLDLYMPGLSGWETLQHLRSGPLTSHIPVVVLSVLSPELRRELAGDAQGWIQKPFNEHLLFAELARVLRSGDGPANVLLVEDDEDLASVITTSFAGSSVRLAHARTRQQAIRECLKRRPDLLILDLTLPDGDGFSFVEWIKAQPGLARLPLVVYSGRDVSDRERSALRLGPTEFLTKTRMQPQDVEALVHSMVRRLRRVDTHAPTAVAS